MLIYNYANCTMIKSEKYIKMYLKKEVSILGIGLIQLRISSGSISHETNYTFFFIVEYLRRWMTSQHLKSNFTFMCVLISQRVLLYCHFNLTVVVALC